MRTPRRLAGMFAAVALALALPAPALAGGGHSHPLELYKVEKHVDVEGDATETVSCKGSDYAIDGMWRVDNVDQDPEISGNIKAQVLVYAAYPDAFDKSRYRFRMENIAGGDAQVKLFVTCLGRFTAANSHTHSFTLSARETDTHAGGPGLGAGFMPGPQQCPAGTIAVAPGFEFTFDTYGRLVASRTSLAGDGPPVGRNWSMVFVLDSPATWKTYMRCLTLKSSVANSHAHRIVVNRVGGSSAVMTPIAAGWEIERQSHCGEHYKGLVHAFDTTPAFAPWLHFFGMDPRIKTRAYRFYNADPVNPIGVWTGLTCFKDRTT